MYEQVSLWVGVGLLLLLCLPIAFLQKIVLEVSAWAVRLVMVGLLASGAYLWFRPSELPVAASNALNNFPGLLSLLPERGSPAFALCLACWIVALLVPVLAVLDVTRKLAGSRLRRIRKLTGGPVIGMQNVGLASRQEELTPVRVITHRPVERRRAADAIAAVGTRAAH